MPNTISTRTALYRLYDASEQLLYIGITNDPLKRLREHSGHQKWWPEATRVRVEWRSTRTEAEEAERDAVKAEKPIYNVIYTGKAPQKKPCPQAQPMTRAELDAHIEEQGRQYRRAWQLLEEAGVLPVRKSLAQTLGELDEAEGVEHLRLLRSTWNRENS